MEKCRIVEESLSSRSTLVVNGGVLSDGIPGTCYSSAFIPCEWWGGRLRASTEAACCATFPDEINCLWKQSLSKAQVHT